MRMISAAFAATFLLSVSVPAPTSAAGLAQTVGGSSLTLTAVDGVQVHGLLYRAKNPKAMILLFHQAGSSKDEYAAIAPRLAASGYSALAIDQRSGGGLFGRNDTVAGLGRPATYLEAKRDLDAALDWATKQGSPVVLWGSSYSAALVFLVASEHPNGIEAVLAFSPGEYLGEPDLVRETASHVRASVYVTSADDPTEIAAAQAILAASPAPVKEQYVPRQGGVHGSSTLIAARDRKGAAANWRAVLAFLARLG